VKILISLNNFEKSNCQKEQNINGMNKGKKKLIDYQHFSKFYIYRKTCFEAFVKV